MLGEGPGGVGVSALKVLLSDKLLGTLKAKSQGLKLAAGFLADERY